MGNSQVMTVMTKKVLTDPLKKSSKSCKIMQIPIREVVYLRGLFALEVGKTKQLPI